MSSIDNKNIEEYINNVCGLIKNKKVHESVSDELLSHIEEIVEFNTNEGKSEEEAINKALIQMGSYDVIGNSLNKVHKAEPDWVLLIMTSIFVLFSIFIMGFMNKNNALGEYNSNSYLLNTVIYSAIGIGIAYWILKIDYRNLKKYSKSIYIGVKQQ